jgi:hypothetical protein
MRLEIANSPNFSTDVEPWERQEGESRKAYLAFETCRDAEEPRSYRKVSQGLHKSLALIGRWGRTWRWQARLNAYLRHLEIVAARERVRAISEMNERHASIAKQCLEKITETLSDPNGGPIPLPVIAKLLTAAADVERLAMGLTTECLADGTSPSSPNSTSVQRPAPDDIVSERIKRLSAVDRGLLRQLYLKTMDMFIAGAKEIESQSVGQASDFREPTN